MTHLSMFVTVFFIGMSVGMIICHAIYEFVNKKHYGKNDNTRKPDSCR